VILGRGGISSTIPFKLDDEERRLIEKSAASLRAVISETNEKLQKASVI